MIFKRVIKPYKINVKYALSNNVRFDNDDFLSQPQPQPEPLFRLDFCCNIFREKLKSDENQMKVKEERKPFKNK